MADYYFVSEKTGKKYKVVKFDESAGKVTLVGDAGIEFENKYDKELFKKVGYRLQAT